MDIRPKLAAESELRPNPPEPESNRPRAFLVRLPIVDQHEAVVGYELGLQPTDLRCEDPNGDSEVMRERILLGLLGHPDIARLTANKLTTITLSTGSLAHPALDNLPRELVIVVPGPRPLTPEFILQLRALSEKGFRTAIDYVPHLDGAHPGADSLAEDSALVEMADFVRLDIERCDAIQLARAVRELGSRQGVRMMASGLTCLEEFEVCRSLPFEYLQGTYFSLHRYQKEIAPDPTRTAVIELLNRTRANADIRVLEGIFKRDPLLTFRLLRYINSPGCGLTHEIRSIAQALMALGYDQLYRWLTLLLFSRGEQGGNTGAFVTNALARGRLVELLGYDKLPRPARDSLFIVGVFSMLDVLLGASLETALASIHLSADVEAALLRREGMFAPFLELALACEQGWSGRAAAVARECGLDDIAVNTAHVSALVWAESVTQAP